MCVCVECCVLSGRGPCDGLIPRPEKSYRLWVYDRSLVGIVDSKPPRAWVSVCVECCVLSGTGLCDGLITRPEKSYRL